MRELSIDEIKRIEIDILDYIDFVCKSNNISYYLDCGTLLGAIRHKGFIPWDDDIDIVVKRKDINRLYELLKDGEKYKMISCENTDNYFLASAKIVDTTTLLKYNKSTIIETSHGVFIDVFPLDNYPDNKLMFKVFNLKCKWTRLLWSYAAYPRVAKSPIDYICNLIVGNKGPRYYAMKLNKVASKYSNKDTKYSMDILAAEKLGKVAQNEWFVKTIDVIFEGKKYPAPKGYDNYLKMMYGNYMQLPPKDKRIPLHDFKAYSIDE